MTNRTFAFIVAAGESAIAGPSVRLCARVELGVAICILDRRIGVGGLAHVDRARCAQRLDEHAAAVATPRLIDRLYEHGARRGALEAALVAVNPPEGTVFAALEVLREYNIRVARLERSARTVEVQFEPHGATLDIRPLKARRGRAAALAAQERTS